MLNGTTEHHGLAGIRFLSFDIWIQDDNVANTEIGHVVICVFREPQLDIPDSPCGFFAWRQQGQAIIDVPRLSFLFQRVEPCGCKAGTFLGLVAKLGHDMLVGDKGQETEIIGFLQG